VGSPLGFSFGLEIMVSIEVMQKQALILRKIVLEQRLEAGQLTIEICRNIAAQINGHASWSQVAAGMSGEELAELERQADAISQLLPQLLQQQEQISTRSCVRRR